MKPTLLILAAGMGSRYGGLKQIDGIGPNEEPIIEYSIYDKQTLKLTNNKSVGKNFVDYFFHEDLQSLEKLFESNFIKKKTIHLFRF